ncbi:MAG: hypothetical protein B7Z75_03995 [Acidocella sp. 20-57-95]|nr:MAG: hypothetical protein B7Z75_03995 [Acidocella sp. 20-57-95]OYV57883.1 MAG: hypothetical protein B7Z71_11755 [Acidocella sp. 21-58-7]HQT63908.1 hypothetical protein [Acidocella sp.]HQU05443.1 hypothetical protein [Acidocella sp.]
MADQSDVEIAIQSIIATALYPNGALQESTVGLICRIYRGLPMAPALEENLVEQVVNITINADRVMKNTTRYPRIWHSMGEIVVSLLVVRDAQTLTFSGVCAVGQLAGIGLNGEVYAYAVQAMDTPATVASNIAVLLRDAGWIVDYSGASITLPQAYALSGRVVASVGALQEVKRQEQRFQIGLWCPDPASRDLVAPVIDQALACQQFIPLADGANARLIFIDSESTDAAENAGLYKRTLTYSAEYPTTIAQFTPAMLFGVSRYSGNNEYIETINS